MKRKIIHICLLASFFINVILGSYIVIYNPICEREHLDVVYRSYNWVSNEEMAQELAEACLGLEDDWELQDNPKYEVEVIFCDSRYEWIVVFIPRGTEKGEMKIVGVRRDHGTITNYVD